MKRTTAPPGNGVISFAIAPEIKCIAASNIAAGTDNPAHGLVQLK